MKTFISTNSKIVTAVALILATGLPFGVASGSGPEEKARSQLEIPELELLPSYDKPVHFMNLDVQVGYVPRDVRPGGGQYWCGGTDQSAVGPASQVVAEALQELDAGVVESVELKYLLLCDGLKADGTAIGGVAVPPMQVLALDIGSAGEHLKKGALHEFFHYAEYRKGVASDSQWRQRFGGYQPSAGWDEAIGSGASGFINSYAMTGPREDRAELFSLLVFNPEEVRRFAERRDDSVIREKIEFVRDKYESMFGERL